MINLSSYHSNGLPPVVWPNKVNLIGEKVYKPKIHFCEHCNKPILIYGRLIPCKHVFCYTCATLCLNAQITTDSDEPGQASEPGKGCHRCGYQVLRVEWNTLNSISVCQVDTCKRTYLSARDLQAHVAHRHSKIKTHNSEVGASSASMAAISSSPYISSSTLMHLNNHNHNINTNTSSSHRQSSSSSSNVNTTGNDHINSPNNNSSNRSERDSHHQQIQDQTHHMNYQHHNSISGGSGTRDRERHRDRERERDRERDRARDHDRDRDRARYSRGRDIYQRDRERERDSKEYHRQSLQRAAQWAEASAQMLGKGLTR